MNISHFGYKSVTFNIVTGWWISEKLDGVRAYWDGRSFYSRLGNEFIPPSWFVKDLPTDMTLDGELFGGRGKFQKTVSIVKTAGSGRWKELQYYVFDAPSIKKPFEARIDDLKYLFESSKCSTVVVIPQVKCKGKDNLFQCDVNAVTVTLFTPL